MIRTYQWSNTLFSGFRVITKVSRVFFFLLVLSSISHSTFLSLDLWLALSPEEAQRLWCRVSFSSSLKWKVETRFNILCFYNSVAFLLISIHQMHFSLCLSGIGLVWFLTTGSKVLPLSENCQPLTANSFFCCCCSQKGSLIPKSFHSDFTEYEIM